MTTITTNIQRIASRLWRDFKSPDHTIYWILGIALAVRVISIFVFPTHLTDDSSSYLEYGKVFINNQITLREAFTFAPLYAMLAGTTENLFARSDSLFALRLIQVLVGTATCGLIWRIAFRLTKNFWSAVIAALGIALNPIFLIDASGIATETVFIFFVVWALSIYITVYDEGVSPPSTRTIMKASAAAGALL